MGFGKDGKGVIITDTDSIDIGALAANTVVKQGNPLVFQDDFRLLRAEIYLSTDGTPAADDAWVIGLADNELSVGEIEEALSTGGPVDRNDRVSDERASRPVWTMDIMGRGASGESTRLFSVRTMKPRWTFSDSEGFTWWARNNTGTALAASVTLRFTVKYFGVWV